jgi:hypothetical protein
MTMAYPTSAGIKADRKTPCAATAHGARVVAAPPRRSPRGTALFEQPGIGMTAPRGTAQNIHGTSTAPFAATLAGRMQGVIAHSDQPGARSGHDRSGGWQ